jgi:pyruvate/2-oxoglutarate dehydrogenase complex dihydrolipoamide dehydrogenase (E3) component
MHDLIIIGAGPGGIALAAEAFASGILLKFLPPDRNGQGHKCLEHY